MLQRRVFRHTRDDHRRGPGNARSRTPTLSLHHPFVEALDRKVRALDIGHRVEARIGDMTRLDSRSGSFDLPWCEGAIFVLGFDEALHEWRRLLESGGSLAVTDAAWLEP